MGSDAYVIQPYLGQKSISFYVFREETENTVLGEVCKGIVINTSVDKGKWCYANPILVNPLDETAIEFDVSLNLKIHKKDLNILTLTPIILLA